MSTRKLFLIAICCVAKFTIAYSATEQPAPAASLLNGSGSYELQLTSGDVITQANTGMPLFPNDVALTFDDGLLSLLLSDETLIKLSRNSRFILREVADNAGWNPARQAGSGSRYQMQSGKLWFLNKNTDNDIRIETPTATAAIRGTEVQIEVLDDTTSIISVLEGQVEASNQFGSVLVGAGQQAVARPGAAPFLQALVDPETAVQWTIAIPNLFASVNFPLISNDAAFLGAEQGRLGALLAAVPGDPANRTALARVRRDQGYAEEALGLINEVIARDGETDERLLILGWSLLDTGADLEQALAVFDRIAAPSPLSRLGQVVANMLLENYSEADALVSAFLATAADQAAINQFRVADAWLDLFLGDINAARDTLLALTDSQPDYGDAWALLSLTQILLLDNPAALDAALTATRVAPQAVMPWLYMANVYQAEQDLESAEAATRTALALDDNNVTARYMLARLLFSSDFTGEAITVAESALAAEPDNTDLNTLMGFMQLAVRDGQRAEEYFGRAVNLRPADAEAHLGRALAYTRQGLQEGALKEISTAVLASPRRALFRSYWAKILYQFRRHRQALDVLDIAENIDAQDPTPFLYRSLILRDLNRPLDALSALNEAIRLNDNRGVYRSRFLLDKDLAIKNIDLSIIYRTLNLGKWAQHKASASTKLDYGNASAHLFLGGSYAGDPERSWARNSENLIARLLMPATVNTFNTFNDYTVMFEQPSMQANLEVEAGNFDTLNGSAIVFGGDPELNLSYQLGYISERTDGWRETNGSRSENPVLFVKWSPAEDQSLMLVGAKSDNHRSDNFSRRYEFDSPAKPRNRLSGDVQRFELGYHLNTSPNSDILLHYADLDSETHLSDYTCLLEGCDDEIFSYLLEDYFYNQPFRLSQVQFMHPFGDHQIIAGGNYLEGDDDLDYSASLVTDSELRSLAEASFALVRRSSTYYVHDIWNVSGNVTLEGALYRDDYKTNNLFTNTMAQFSRTGHRLGALYESDSGWSARAFTVDYVLPYFSDRLEPTDIAGIPVYRNGSPGSMVEEDHLRLGKEWGSGFAALSAYALDRELNAASGPGAESVNGIQGSLNMLFHDSGAAEKQGFSFTSVLDLQDIDSTTNSTVSRDELRVDTGLTWTNQRGLLLTFSQSYRNIDYRNIAMKDEKFWLSDVEVVYQLNDRKGKVKLRVNNLFDKKINWYTDNFIFAGRTPRREILLTLTLNL